MSPTLLNRNTFREAVFVRDNHRCVICGADGQDAHHIIERRLFNNGGYFLDNGATLCGEHHICAEQTLLSCDEIRSAAGITNTVLPPHLYADEQWDKWGNLILQNKQRIPGELFNDASVQKILESAGLLHIFVKWIKYPRTYHLPNSPGKTKDDCVLSDTQMFNGRRVIITEKMDGENTTLYTDYIHARSIDSDNHSTRDWIKNYQAKVGWNIPSGWRVCGENLWAKHSIYYDSLISYFEAFSIWNEYNICLDWDTTLEWLALMGIQHVPILYDGLWNDTLIERFVPDDTNKHEGFVVRLAQSFSYSQFRESVAKWVRPNHVNTSHHWKRQAIKKNTLKAYI